MDAYRELFEKAPLSMCVLDASGVKKYLDRLRQEGTTDLIDYFAINPESLTECLSLARVLDVNACALELSGAVDKQEFGERLTELLCDETYALMIKQMMAMAEGLEDQQGEAVMRTLGGDRLNIFLKWTTMPDATAAYSRMLVSAADVTGRTAMEERLRAAAAEWRDTFDATQDLVFILDPDFRVIRANAAAARFLRMPENEITGHCCYELMHGSQEPIEGCPLDVFSNTGTHSEAELFLENHGIWAQISADPIYGRDGSVSRIVHIVKDITERKQAEANLKESERLYRMLADNTQDLICMIDTRGKRVYVSPSYQHVLGYEPEELLGDGIFGLVHPEDLKRVEQVRAQGVGTGGLVSFRHRVRHRDGHYLWASTHGTPLYNEEGKLIGGLVVSWNIDDMVEAEERQRESERLYRVLADNIQDLVSICDSRRRRIYVSPSYRSVLGYEPEELMGEPLFDLLHPDDLEKASLELEQGKSVERNKISRHRIRHKDGHYIWFESHGTPLYDEDGKMIGGLAVSWNVSERAEAEEILNREREQLISIFDSINQIIYVTDPHTNEILYVNRFMRDAFGKELVGGTCYREFQGFDEPCEFCTNHIILGNQGKPYIWEYHNPLLDRDLLIVDRIIKWSDGRDVRFELAVDITERVRAEEKLREHNEELKNFLAVAAHELRHPICLVQGYANTLVEFQQEMDQKVLEEVYGNIRVASHRLTSLVEELLEVSRIEKERFATECSVVDPAGCLREVVGEMRERGVANPIETEIDSEVETWSLDQEKFHQLLVILLDNAVKYSPQGSPIEVEMVKTPAGLSVAIKDRGNGVSEAHREKVFQRFFQVEDRHHHSVPGLGLGLYIAREIVGGHEGSIWQESRSGGGSVFRFNIP